MRCTLSHHLANLNSVFDLGVGHANFASLGEMTLDTGDTIRGNRGPDGNQFF
jgi:hypothetical protein